MRLTKQLEACRHSKLLAFRRSAYFPSASPVISMRTIMVETAMSATPNPKITLATVLPVICLQFLELFRGVQQRPFHLFRIIIRKENPGILQVLSVLRIIDHKPVHFRFTPFIPFKQTVYSRNGLRQLLRQICKYADVHAVQLNFRIGSNDWTDDSAE